MLPDCQNDEPEFDARIEKALGWYVYVLRDPLQAGRVFYVGKGGGSGAGNARVLAHFEEARRALGAGSKPASAKVQRIHAIWAAGQKVEWEVVRRGLPDDRSAFHVEAALIDLLGRDNLTNVQGGNMSDESSGLSSREVYRLAAPPVNPSRDYGLVLLFNIEKALNSGGRSPYDATRGWWANTGPYEHATHAVGLVRGISVCVVEIERWLSLEDDVRQRGIVGVPTDYIGKDWEKDQKRRGFEGKPFIESGSHELLDKNYKEILSQVSGFWGYGNWIAVEFEAGKAIIRRGLKS